MEGSTNGFDVAGVSDWRRDELGTGYISLRELEPGRLQRLAVADDLGTSQPNPRLPEDADWRPLPGDGFVLE
jgi:hypothetical protein